MKVKIKNNLMRSVSEILSAFFITISVIPGFRLLGDIFLQVLATGLFAFLIVFIADLLNVKPVIIAHSLIFMTAFWVITATAMQLSFQIKRGFFTVSWQHLFYYDKIAMLFVVFTVAVLFYMVKLLMNINNIVFINEYSSFIKLTQISFGILYILTLIYSFFLCRTPGTQHGEYNIKPLQVIVLTFFSGRLDYERVILFFGNIVIFLPLGIFLSALLHVKHKAILFLIPLFISSFIEITQYIFHMGHCDIDDVILNVSGFLAGAGIKTLTDKIIYKVSKGKLSSAFIF